MKTKRGERKKGAGEEDPLIFFGERVESASALASFLTLLSLFLLRPSLLFTMQFDLGDDLDLGSAAAAVVPAPRAAAPATILVVGSPSAAGDGSYQALITELSSVGTVENEMVDRIVDAGQFLPLPLPLPFSFRSVLPRGGI